MFRVRTTNWQWMTTPFHWDGVGLSGDKADARIFPASDRKYMEYHPTLIAVDLEEDEAMDRMSQPRLEGF